MGSKVMTEVNLKFKKVKKKSVCENMMPWLLFLEQGHGHGSQGHPIQVLF